MKKSGARLESREPLSLLCLAGHRHEANREHGLSLDRAVFLLFDQKQLLNERRTALEERKSELEKEKAQLLEHKEMLAQRERQLAESEGSLTRLKQSFEGYRKAAESELQALEVWRGVALIGIPVGYPGRRDIGGGFLLEYTGDI